MKIMFMMNSLMNLQKFVGSEMNMWIISFKSYAYLHRFPENDKPSDQLILNWFSYLVSISERVQSG
jgi:hypothetical protein